MIHVVQDLPEYALNILDAQRSREVSEHLKVCHPCLREFGSINDSIVDAIVGSETAAPPTTRRQRLLEDVAAIAPYSIYHQEMADILDAPVAQLTDHLGRMPHPSTWIDGPIPRCRLYPYVKGPESEKAIRTLVMMESGSHFPRHEHLGDETVLVLQGSMLHEDGRLYRPGDVLKMGAGTFHHFDIPEGLDLIYLAVVHKGLKIGEQLITPASL